MPRVEVGRKPSQPGCLPKVQWRTKLEFGALMVGTGRQRFWERLKTTISSMTRGRTTLPRPGATVGTLQHRTATGRTCWWPVMALPCGLRNSHVLKDAARVHSPRLATKKSRPDRMVVMWVHDAIHNHVDQRTGPYRGTAFSLLNGGHSAFTVERGTTL